jgi:hypothetical protein
LPPSNLAPEVPCIVIKWTGFANSQQLRYLVNQTQTHYIAEAKRWTVAVGWIADSRGLGAIKSSDHEWLHTE